MQFGLFIIPVIIANLHVAVFPFFFILFIPYIADYLVHLMGKSGIAKNQKRLKRGRSLNQEEIIKIQNRIEILEKRKQRADENAYKIMVTKNGNSKWLIAIMIICVATGLFTPLGTTPYTYLYNTMIGETTRKYC